MDGQILFIMILGIIVIYAMGLMLWKYYDMFSKRDKKIIAYGGILLTIIIPAFLFYYFGGANSFFLGIFPFLILTSVFKLLKLYRSSNGMTPYSIMDQILFIVLESLAIIIGAFIYYHSNTQHPMYILFGTLLALGYQVLTVLKLYSSNVKD